VIFTPAAVSDRAAIVIQASAGNLFAVTADATVTE